MVIQKGERISPATEFKKGIIPQNKLPIGSETVRTHKGDYPRIWIKVKEPNVWIMKSVYLWLSAGYEIPQGCVIHHLNKIALDDRLENLCLLTRAAHRLIHDDELKNGKIPGKPLPTKTIICSKCSIKYKGQIQRVKSYCQQCAKERHREKDRAYKKRLHSKCR
uniref:Putative homing endonuclease n=1 Tax=viral metagenome TaxID=1070528 RepID=A0A6M3XHJ2_9ZZZZ